MATNITKAPCARDKIPVLFSEIPAFMPGYPCRIGQLTLRESQVTPNLFTINSRLYERKPEKNTAGTYPIGKKSFKLYPVPHIRLEGKWLEKLGFRTCGHVEVEARRGKLVIRPVASGTSG
jgi:hypothetical protein